MVHQELEKPSSLERWLVALNVRAASLCFLNSTGEAGVPFLTCVASEFDEVFVGVGASRIQYVCTLSQWTGFL